MQPKSDSSYLAFMAKSIYFMKGSNLINDSFEYQQQATSRSALCVKRSQRNPASVIEIFLKFSYFFCFTPFKIDRKKNGKYILHKWLPQQIICFMALLTSLCLRATELRTAWMQEKWNPSSFFRVFYNTSNLVFYAIAWWTVWYDSESFLKLVRYADYVYYTSSPNKFDRLVRNASAVVTLLSIIHAVTATCIFGFGLGILSYPRWDPYVLWNCLNVKTKQVLFITKNGKCPEKNYFSGDLGFFEILSGLLGSFSVYVRRVNGLYGELLLFVGALAYWLAAKSFVLKIQSLISFQQWPSVYGEYLKLKKYGDLTNRAFGLLFLVYTLTALFYYSINLDKFLTSHDVLVRLKYSAYYFNLVSTFVLAADINKQVSYEMESWISRNSDEESISIRVQNQITLVLHEITNHRIGMSGYHLFTVTYSIAAQMAGILITYFIICVQ